MWIESDGCLCEDCRYEGVCEFQDAVVALQKAASKMRYFEPRIVYHKTMNREHKVVARIQIEGCGAYESTGG